MQNAFVADEGTDAWSLVRDGVTDTSRARTRPGTRATTRPTRDALTPRGVTDDELRAGTPAGTPEEVVRALRPKVEALAEPAARSI